MKKDFKQVLKEKYQKLKFIIPLFYGSAAIAFINEKVSEGKLKLIMCVVFLTAMYSVIFYRMQYDKKYIKKAKEFIAMEKQRPWYDRTRFYGLGAWVIVYGIIFCVAGVASVLNFFYMGFAHQKWLDDRIFYAFVSFFLSWICYKALKMK